MSTEQDTFLRSIPADQEHNFPGGIISEQLTYYFHSHFLLTLSLFTSQAEGYLNKWSQFEAPKLVAKLEAKVQKKIGEEVIIELFKIPGSLSWLSGSLG